MNNIAKELEKKYKEAGFVSFPNVEIPIHWGIRNSLWFIDNPLLKEIHMRIYSVSGRVS